MFFLCLLAAYVIDGTALETGDIDPFGVAL
jgi:hypothetical protein